MVRVVGIDHLVIRVSNYEKSKAFYGRLFGFLGFEISDEYADAIGWTNGKTRFWIGPAEGAKRKYRSGDVGFHHYAFQLRSRKDVDALQAFLEAEGVKIVDPAGEGPKIWFQPVPEKKTVKTRFHFDIYVADRSAPMEEIVATVDAKVAELVERGATIDHPNRIDTETLQRYGVVMHDPEGNEFCVA